MKEKIKVGWVQGDWVMFPLYWCLMGWRTKCCSDKKGSSLCMAHPGPLLLCNMPAAHFRRAQRFQSAQYVSCCYVVVVRDNAIGFHLTVSCRTKMYGKGGMRSSLCFGPPTCFHPLTFAEFAQHPMRQGIFGGLSL